MTEEQYRLSVADDDRLGPANVNSKQESWRAGKAGILAAAVVCQG